MSTPNYILNTCLNFVEPYTIECLILFLFFVLKEKDLKYVFLLTVCTRLINALIKSFLPISEFPDPALRGSPFPSGHLQISSVFFVWVFYRFKSIPLKALSSFILYSGAYSQVYYCYHYVFDVVGACVFSNLVVFGFFRFTKNNSDFAKMAGIASFAILAMVTLLFFGLECYQQNDYLIKTCYKIVGFSAAYFVIYKYSLRTCCFGLLGIGFLSLVFYNVPNAFFHESYRLVLFGLLPILKSAIECFKKAIASKVALRHVTPLA